MSFYSWPQFQEKKSLINGVMKISPISSDDSKKILTIDFTKTEDYKAQFQKNWELLVVEFRKRFSKGFDLVCLWDSYCSLKNETSIG